MTKSDDYGTANLTAAGTLKGAKTEFAATAAATDEIKIANDRRLELFMAACRQKKTICGGANQIPDTGASSTMLRTVVAANMSTFEKCTWTMSSKTKAPTFKISGGTVVLGASFEVMYQEWVDGWQLSSLVDFAPIIVSGTAGASRAMNGIVFPHVISTTYAKVAKYNYPTVSGGNTPTDIEASNNAQRSGMAYTLVSPNGAACAMASTDVSTPTSCFDALKRRWFTASDASAGTMAAGANMTTYNGKKTTFNTAATAYNTYLADLKTANEKDAFAAFFAPPTKPAFVKRPATPWMPAAYTGV